MKVAKILDLKEVLADKPFMVVGDIHGMYKQFRSLYIMAGMPDVISVGDLVDRGPRSDTVLNFFFHDNASWAVEGNHDNKFKRFCRGNKVKVANGLDKTIQQTAYMNLGGLAEWIDSWPNIIQVPDVDGRSTYVVHAGIDGRYPIESQHVQTTMYIRGLNPSNYFDESDGIWYDTIPEDMNVIAGHIVEKDWRPRQNIFAMDGGCVHGGVLRGMLVEGNSYKLLEVPGENHGE